MGQLGDAPEARGIEGPAEEPLELAINVLGVREDDAWCAIALEMSLRGYGKTFEAALAELREAIDTQVSFAVQNSNLDQVFIPAELHYFKLYADVKREALKRRLLGRTWTGLPDYRVGDIPLPKPSAQCFACAAA